MRAKGTPYSKSDLDTKDGGTEGRKKQQFFGSVERSFKGEKDIQSKSRVSIRRPPSRSLLRNPFLSTLPPTIVRVEV